MVISKIDRTVVRNKGYAKNNFSIRERHNERKNEIYSNPDIVKERSNLNVHFKQCKGTYAQVFDKMIESGIISTRGLKPDADVFGEMIFDVNTMYFEKHGGYEYAKEFFQEAYKMAISEVGSEEYILSAVMHADERNKSLSEELGRDIFHYHLHVVYIPIVEKEIKWSKRCKDKALIGTVKEVINQVSHSKKWTSVKATDEHGNIIRDENGRAILIPSYSLLQDRFYEHMKEAGFKDFERGVRGSTTQHLSVLNFKIQKDKEKLAQIEKMAEDSKKELTAISDKLTVKREVNKSFKEIEGMGKKTLFGKVELPSSDFKEVIELAKEGIASRSELSDMHRRLHEISMWLLDWKNSYDQLYEQTKDFRQAVKLAPQRVKDTFAEIFANYREQREMKKVLNRSSLKRNNRSR